MLFLLTSIAAFLTYSSRIPLDIQRSSEAMANNAVSCVADIQEETDTGQSPFASSNSNSSSQRDSDMLRFAAVLAQVKHENMACLASSVRQGSESLQDKGAPPSTSPPSTTCKVLPKPLYGSYHLAYRILFEDGVQWILKIPVYGHYASFDRLASEALTSEALTMRMIQQITTIPVPTVHHFDASLDNEIGCPYILMDFLGGKPLWQGWFDQNASRSALEQFRARALQTIAAAWCNFASSPLIVAVPCGLTHQVGRRMLLVPRCQTGLPSRT